MEEQREYARLLHSSGHGIALRQPTHDIDVGDICYWSAQGKALRILNVFDNKDWLAQNNWPALNITRDKIIDKSENNNLQVIHGGGVNWTITNQYNYGFEIMFSRTGNDTAICMPAGPCTITGLRASGKHHIEQWWLRAKRHAFHTWAHLLNDPTGIFLVIKTVKTARYASCLSHGNPGQVSQIRVHGTMKIPRGNEDLDIPINGTQLFPIKNELSMDLYETERRGDFTIFMERDSSFMFRLGEGQMKEAAQKYWEYDPVVNCINGSACIPKNTNQTPLTNQWGAPAPAWGGGISVNWPQPNLAPPAAQPARPSSPATFDGQDRITISEGWFLIRGDGCFFLEHAGTGLDLPVKEISTPT